MYQASPIDDGEFHFGTKGETLGRLAPLVGGARFCDQMIIAVPQWRADPEVVLADVLGRFAGLPLAVRSSSAREDGWDSSMAGSFVSRIDVEPLGEAVKRAVAEVIESYGADGDGDQVLIQPVVRDVAISGVVTTRELDTGSPYYVVNYDDFSGRTDTVTGGAHSKSILVHRSRPDALRSTRFRKLILAVREIESVVQRDELDIEFCITAADEVYILQVRPIAAHRRWQALPDGMIDAALADLRGGIAARMTPAPGLAGGTTIFGEMPDWNPAEMIGNAPRRLALSLYRMLITDGAWWHARANMGYRRVPHPLMVDFAGRPYVDVRLSLNSFLPAGLDDAPAGRIVDAQLARLAGNPDLHDKLEFEVAITCRDFGFADRAAQLAEHDVPRSALDALESGLGRLTAVALSAHAGGLDDLLARTASLRATGSVPGAGTLNDAVLARLASCIPNGTLPFSMLARHAFIGVSMLRSLVLDGVLSEQDRAAFMTGIHTVAGQLVEDMRAVAAGDLEREAFLDEYGHLRPGTYDVLSWRYDERPDLFLGQSARAVEEREPFALSPRQERRIGGLLAAAGYGLSAADLLGYVARAVSARESAKFAFTRNVSDALSALTRWGESHGLSRDDLSHLPIGAILLANGDSGKLRAMADEGRDAYRLTGAIRLPHLIVEPDDIDVVRMPLGRPTFITDACVTARTRLVEANRAPRIDGRIVMIESADPGFDWIFSHPIAGLVTKYGGANSHMAIRCAEFGLPAAIGCGERLFARLSAAAAIELDCAARIVRGAAG